MRDVDLAVVEVGPLGQGGADDGEGAVAAQDEVAPGRELLAVAPAGDKAKESFVGKLCSPL